MQARTYQAPNMLTALERIQDELGPEALIRGVPQQEEQVRQTDLLLRPHLDLHVAHPHRADAPIRQQSPRTRRLRASLDEVGRNECPRFVRAELSHGTDGVELIEANGLTAHDPWPDPSLDLSPKSIMLSSESSSESWPPALPPANEAMALRMASTA